MARAPRYLGVFRRRLHLSNETVVVVVKVDQRCVNLFRSQIGMLPQQFFGRPTVMEVLGGQMDHLVSGRLDPYRSIRFNRQVRIMRFAAHFLQVHNPLAVQFSAFCHAPGAPARASFPKTAEHCRPLPLAV